MHLLFSHFLLYHPRHLILLPLFSQRQEHLTLISSHSSRDFFKHDTVVLLLRLLRERKTTRESIKLLWNGHFFQQILLLRRFSYFSHIKGCSWSVNDYNQSPMVQSYWYNLLPTSAPLSPN